MHMASAGVSAIRAAVGPASRAAIRAWLLPERARFAADAAPAPNPGIRLTPSRYLVLAGSPCVHGTGAA